MHPQRQCSWLGRAVTLVACPVHQERTAHQPVVTFGPNAKFPWANGLRDEGSSIGDGEPFHRARFDVEGDDLGRNRWVPEPVDPDLKHDDVGGTDDFLLTPEANDSKYYRDDPTHAATLSTLRACVNDEPPQPPS